MASPLASSPAQGNGVNHHHKVSGNPTTTVVQPADSELEEERTSEEEDEEEEGDDDDEDANNLEETGSHQQTLAGLQSGLKPNLDESAQKAKDVDHGEEEEGGDDREDEDEDEDDHEDEEDDEEEDEEPSLKYGRLEGDVSVILEKDSASSLAVSGNLMALGTHNGMVHILDLSGKKLKSYRPHSASINDIRIDSHNEFVATAAMDGHNSFYYWIRSVWLRLQASTQGISPRP
ncbi:Vacuolar protein sorting-associated protein 41 [Tulasnella sp. 419]|nr:Vacuolar protein sorting-associated protein 41 [Tulasnella sp. 419]